MPRQTVLIQGSHNHSKGQKLFKELPARQRALDEKKIGRGINDTQAEVPQSLGQLAPVFPDEVYAASDEGRVPQGLLGGALRGKADVERHPNAVEPSEELRIRDCVADTQTGQ